MLSSLEGDCMSKLMVLVMLVCSVVIADIAVTVDARRDLQLTVYKGFGVVRDIRKINIPEGANRIRFEGVATGIDAESVNLDWKSDAGVELIGQSYEFDLVSPSKLMEKYVGREVEIIPSKEEWADSSIQTAELVSIHGKEPVFRVGTKITFGDIGRILFPYMPDNLYTKPTLVWNVFVPKRQETEIAATYLTEGISWNAAYMLQIDQNDDNATFGGWITYHNESGLDCRNAQVTFVAGDVRRVKGKAGTGFLPEVARQTQRDYYFYKMNQRVTVLANHSKQVEWIPQVQLPLKQNYFAEVDHRFDDDYATVATYAAVEVVNSTDNSLGIPLPEGVIRVFKRDANQNVRFIGENLMADTKVGQSFFATIGKTERIHISQKKTGPGDTYQVTIRNTKKGSIKLKVHVHPGDKKILDSSRKYRIVHGSSLEWNIVLKSNEVQKITYQLK